MRKSAVVGVGKMRSELVRQRSVVRDGCQKLDELRSVCLAAEVVAKVAPSGESRS